MADSSQVRTELQIFLQRKSASRVKSTLFQISPFYDFMFAQNGHKKDADNLGRPTAGNLAIGRINGVSSPMREKLFAAREYLPIITTSAPSETEVKIMGDYDSDPTVPNWDVSASSGGNKVLSRFKQARFKFCRYKMPCKVAHSERDTAVSNATTEGQAAAAVGSVYDAEQKPREAALAKRINNQLFAIGGELGYPTDEDSVTWSSVHSLQQAIGSTTNTYGGIDRSLAANAFWKPNVYTSTWTGTFYEAIDYANYEWGMINVGLGVQFILVGKDLMRKAKAEAKQAGYQMVTNGIPDPEFGLSRESVIINTGNRRVFITYDPSMNALDTAAIAAGTTASGEANAFFVDPSTWTVAIPGNKNFKNSKILAANEVDEGGDEADFWNIETQIMLCCEVPSGNGRFTKFSIA